jgi:hypothetical protein
MNLTKKILIQFESAKDTRWLYNDKDLCNNIRCIAGSIVAAHTTGPNPKITVSVEEQPEPAGNVDKAAA